MDDTKRVIIGFYAVQAAADGGWWWSRAQNWLIGKWTSRKGKDFSHVELRFSDLCSTSICQEGGTVHWIDGKLMSNPNYTTFLSIHMSSGDEARMKALALDYYERGVTFNMGGMLCNFMPLFSTCFSHTGEDIEGTQSAVFCSQYIALLLHEAGYVRWLDPTHTTPADLYWALKDGDEGARVNFNYALHKALGKKLDLSKTLAKCPSGRHGFKGN